jgi:CHAT domain-containing protein/Tfp pilus assembly protein PilF
MREIQNSLKLIAARMGGAFIAVALVACAASAQEDGLPEVRMLPVGGAVERELAEQKAHFYMVELEKGEALRVDVAEKGVNCVVAVLESLGGKLHEKLRVNFGNGFDRETVTYVAGQDSAYVVVLASLPGRSGAYRLTAKVSPRAQPPQLKRAEAVRSLADTVELWGANTDLKSKLEVLRRLKACEGLWGELGEDYWAGYAANRMGRVYTELSRKEEAVESLNRALGLFRKAGDRRGESLALNNLGVVYGEFGRYEEAIDFFKSSLPNREEIGDEIGRANVLTALGAMYSSKGSQQAALEYYERALRILQDAKDQEAQANTLSSIASLYIQTGDAPRALANLSKALALLEGTHDIVLKARVLNETAYAYRQVGEFRKALDSYLQSLSLCEESGNKQCAARAYTNLSSINYDLGELGEALERSQKSLALYREIGDEATVALSLQNLARVYAALGDGRRMSDALEEALDLLAGKESEHPQLHASILLQSGDILSGHNYLAGAEKSLRKAVEVSRAINDKASEAAALDSLANVYSKADEQAKSAETYNQALIILTSMGDSDSTASVLSSLMNLWHKAGNPRLATFYGKEALNNYQLLRTNLRSMDRETQKSYLRKNADTYVYLAALLLEQGRYAEALQVINAWRDQQFYDFDSGATAPAVQITLTPREGDFSSAHRQAVGKVAALGLQLDELRRRAKAHPSGEEERRLADLKEQLKTASAEFSSLLRRAADDFARAPHGGEEGARVKELAEMQSVLRELSVATGKKTVALYPLAGPESFRVLLITADSAHTAATPFRAGDLDVEVLQYYAVLQTPGRDPRPLGKELYNLIVKPLEPTLRAAGAQTLLWSLGGTLRYVPMASLWDGKKYLVERFDNVVFTRADRERMTRAVSPVWVGVGFGNSRAHSVDPLGDGNKVDFEGLLGVSEELPAIFRPAGRDGVVKGEVFMDGEFTKSSFLSLAKRRPALVHVASHFSFRPGDDAQSFLLLGDGTTLTLKEIKQQGRLFEGVELLTLSACETAATRADAMGREIDGFAESAQRLGAGAVMATLWTVADNSTSRLMREFYRARQGIPLLTKAEALRRAQLALLSGASGGRPAPATRASVPTRFKVELVDALGGRRRAFSYTGRGGGAEIIYIEKSQAPTFTARPDKPFAHPYYWAPFILIGNGR